MANSKGPLSGTVAAEPEPIALDFAATALLIIDMQRDFMEPGGFGETLGNDVSQLARAAKPIAAVLEAARDIGMLVVLNRGGALSGLAGGPPAQIERGAAAAHRRSRPEGPHSHSRQRRPRHHSRALSARQ